MSSDPSLDYTLPFQLTKTIHRDVYDLVSPDNPANSQKGKIIVITGGGTGIGAAAANVWIRAGAAGVVIAGRRKDVLDKTVTSLEGISNGTKVLGVQTDIRVENDAQNLFAKVTAVFGRPADVVLANAGLVTKLKPFAEEKIDTWWNVLEINLKGLHNTIVGFIRSQPDPKNPVGTVINVNSGLVGSLVPGNSAYAISKLASHRYMEFVGLEYPLLRSFTLLPGIVLTDMSKENESFTPYAKDAAELTGGFALYLALDRADYLRNSLTSVNWDIEEMEAHKQDIAEGNLLRIKWVAPLPCSGGSGFSE